MSAVSLWRRLTTEPARPARVRDSRYAPWLVVGTVCVGAFMGQLDASIVTLGLPTLQHEFHASLGQVEWVALSYLIALVGAVTVVGWVADMAGRKLLYTYGFGVFTIGAALCGLAPSLPGPGAGEPPKRASQRFRASFSRRNARLGDRGAPEAPLSRSCSGCPSAACPLLRPS